MHMLPFKRTRTIRALRPPLLPWGRDSSLQPPSVWLSEISIISLRQGNPINGDFPLVRLNALNSIFYFGITDDLYTCAIAIDILVNS